MNNYGFIITKLSLRGPGKEHAELILKNGLNVISGPSDTGKSFIFQCLNFIFGGKDVPKPINESEGYKELFVEIETYSNEILTLKRSLTDSKMYVFHSNIDDIDRCAPDEIINQHNKVNPNNISTLLLKLCGATYKNIFKNKKMQTESFTFRYFSHLTMLSEKKIISEASPIYDDSGNRSKPKHESAFKTIITGIDTVISENTKKDETNNVKIEAKLELIDEMIINIKNEINSIEELTDIDKDLVINTSVDELRKAILNKKIELKKLEKEREEGWKDLQRRKSENLYFSELKKRFNILKISYESDYERLEFIDEAEFYLNQLVDVKCPLCNSTIESSSILNKEELRTAILVERGKIDLQLNDLLLTIKEAEDKVKGLEEDVIKKESALQVLENMIEDDAKQDISTTLSQVDELLRIKKTLGKIEYLNEKKGEMEQTKSNLTKLLGKEKVIVTNKSVITDSIYNELCKIVKEIFEGWAFKKDSSVDFDKSTMDLKIGGELKKTFGKGYGALINSAFVIAIMQYAINLDLPHPKIVILDSPLTAYKEKDKDKGKDQSKVNDEVKQEFYKYLSKMDKHMQIIVLDNVEPNDNIIGNINHYHFTGSNDIARRGFIP